MRYEYDAHEEPIHVVDVLALLAGRDPIPLRVAVCMGCGAVVADKGIHDRACAAVGGLQYQNQPRESVNKVAERS